MRIKHLIAGLVNGPLGGPGHVDGREGVISIWTRELRNFKIVGKSAEVRARPVFQFDAQVVARYYGADEEGPPMAGPRGVGF